MVNWLFGKVEWGKICKCQKLDGRKRWKHKQGKVKLYADDPLMVNVVIPNLYTCTSFIKAPFFNEWINKICTYMTDPCKWLDIITNMLKGRGKIKEPLNLW